jgi:hypothetical protein
MNFTDISTLHITTELEILKRDTQRYNSFLYQHKGVFFADNMRIGNKNQEESRIKFINVLTKAKEENISLVLSPEYSCPKSVIAEIIANPELQPSQQKLWVLGGESLNKDELKSFRDLENQKIHIHFEDCFSDSNKTYVDPLYYIFQGQHNNDNKLIILIQFKTRHMGVWSGDVERNNLIHGKDIYIIKNNMTSTRLMTFICSEAMNVRDYLNQHVKDEILWEDMPFLILNPQINPDPSHQDFVNFRRFILENEKKEIITLNWGKGTYFNGHDWYASRGNTARSGIFIKTNQLNYNKDFIENNHYKGLYFLYIDINYNKYVFYLNSIPEIFHIEHNAVDINIGVQPQRRREGPQVLQIYNFNDDFEINDMPNINDNHIINLEERGVVNTYFLDETKSIIDKEILVNLLRGKVQSKEQKRWSNAIHLNSFSLRESDECNNRLTYVEDTYENSESIRTFNCTCINEMDQNILPNPTVYPHNIKHLKDKNLSLAFANNADTFYYKYNVINDSGNLEKATICYVGSAVSNKVVEKAYDELQKLFEEDSPGKDTIVVFYKNGNSLLEKSNPDAGAITKTPTSNNSITE